MRVSDPVADFLSAYDPAVQELAEQLRTLVQRLVPDAEEKLHRPWKTVAYGRERKFCAISPHKAWVNLQFHAGSKLGDPKGLLEGTGKSMRHVKIAKPADVKRRALADLVREAARLAG